MNNPISIEEILNNIGAIGKENRCSTDNLLRLTRLTTARDLCAAVKAERHAGALILSTKADGGGYYMPGTIEEVKEFISTFESEAKSTFAMLKAARDFIKRNS